MGCVGSKHPAEEKRPPGYEEPEVLASETACKSVVHPMVICSSAKTSQWLQAPCALPIVEG